MMATVTLWSKEGEEEIGISEFVLYEPDEKRFRQRTHGLFAMVLSPYARLTARVGAFGSFREVDVTMVSAERVADLLWEAYVSLQPQE